MHGLLREPMHMVSLPFYSVHIAQISIPVQKYLHVLLNSKIEFVYFRIHLDVVSLINCNREKVDQKIQNGRTPYECRRSCYLHCGTNLRKASKPTGLGLVKGSSTGSSLSINWQPPADTGGRYDTYSLDHTLAHSGPMQQSKHLFCAARFYTTPSRISPSEDKSKSFELRG